MLKIYLIYYDEELQSVTSSKREMQSIYSSLQGLKNKTEVYCFYTNTSEIQKVVMIFGKGYTMTDTINNIKAFNCNV